MRQIEILQGIIAHWEHFCHNYRSATRDGITYPSDFDSIQWAHGDAEHMRDKWAEVCDRHGCEGSAAMHPFFNELDSENQQALLEYVYRDIV